VKNVKRAVTGQENLRFGYLSARYIPFSESWGIARDRPDLKVIFIGDKLKNLQEGFGPPQRFPMIIF
jgi:hypothetical protein